MTKENERTYQLSPEELAVLTEYDQSFERLQSEARGALRMIASVHKLTGNWDRQGDKLIKQQEKS